MIIVILHEGPPNLAGLFLVPLRYSGRGNRIGGERDMATSDKKVALITGANKGIGFEISSFCQRAARYGCQSELRLSRLGAD